MQPTRQLDLTLAELLQQLRTGQLTAEDYAGQILAQELRLHSLNVLVSLDAESFLAEARAADAVLRRGREAGELTGVPILVKDNINTAGRLTMAGTAGLATNVPDSNAPVLQRLLDAGAIVFGKANLQELAFGITCNNLHTGPVRNPYDPRMIPGGSSGGTAAAVAARIAPAGLGSDTGGSVRIPAALCGVVGFRPTTGRYLSKGVVPISHTFDTPGPITRTAEDAAILDRIIAPPHSDAADAGSPPRLAGLRFGVPRAALWSGVAVEVGQLLDGALEKLRDHGAALVEVDLPDVRRLVDEAGFTIVLFELLPDMEAYLADSRTGLTVDDLVRGIEGLDVRQSFASASAITRASYAAALDARKRLQAAYAQCFQENGLDAVVFPTTPLEAAPIGLDETVDLNGILVPTFATYIRNTFPGAIAGIPGITLPAGLTAAGLPVALELDGPANSDPRLLQIGISIEREALPPLAPPKPAVECHQPA